MTAARDELVGVIAEALVGEAVVKDASGANALYVGVHAAIAEAQAQAVLAALVSRYGEPEIEAVRSNAARGIFSAGRRLVFPWQPVTGADQ